MQRSMCGATSKATILIVDNDVAVHELIGRGLATEPYRIESARTARDGVRQAAAIDPELILLGFHLPDAQAWDLCRELRSNERTTSATIILLIIPSEPSAPDHQFTGLKLRPADRMARSIKAPALRERVRTALREKRLLDLLPGASPRGGWLNRELTTTGLRQARQMNPWQRIPPVSVWI